MSTWNSELHPETSTQGTRGEIQPQEPDESGSKVCPHRRVSGTVGDPPQCGPQRGLHERSQHEEGLQIVADGALSVALMFYRAATQQTRLVD